MSLPNNNFPVEVKDFILSLHEKVTVLLTTSIKSDAYDAAYTDVYNVVVDLMRFHPNWNETSKEVNYDDFRYDNNAYGTVDLPLGWAKPEVEDEELSDLEILVEEIFYAVQALNDPTGSMWSSFSTIEEKTYASLATYHPDYNIDYADFRGAVED